MPSYGASLSDKGGAMGPGVKALLQYITSAAMSMTHSEAQVELMEIKNKKICVNESAEEMRAKCADLLGPSKLGGALKASHPPPRTRRHNLRKGSSCFGFILKASI